MGYRCFISNLGAKLAGTDHIETLLTPSCGSTDNVDHVLQSWQG